MRAVRGDVACSEAVSISRASAIISNFAATADTGVRGDVTAYVKRAVSAFNELSVLHKELRARHKTRSFTDPEEIGDGSKSSGKKNKKIKDEFTASEDDVKVGEIGNGEVVEIDLEKLRKKERKRSRAEEEEGNIGNESEQRKEKKRRKKN